MSRAITAETITLRQVEILRYLSGKKWRTCEEWSIYSRKDVEPLVKAGLANYAHGGFRSSRRGITLAGRELLSRFDAMPFSAFSRAKSAALARTQSADLLPLYEPPPERLAGAGELKGRLGFEFKRTVTIARSGGPGALRAVHAALLGASFCDFTDEPIEKWAGVGHEWVKIEVASVDEAVAAEVGPTLRKRVTCGGCLNVLSSPVKLLDRMCEIVRTHG